MNDRAERSISGRLAEVCDAFKQALQSNDHPKIATYLKSFDGPQRLELLRELILLDVDYRYRPSTTNWNSSRNGWVICL